MKRIEHNLCLILLLMLLMAGVAAMAACPGSLWAAEPQPVRIMVFCSHKAQPFEEALEAFKQQLPAQGITAQIEVCALDGDAGKAAPAIEKSRNGGFQLILALGSLAVETLSSKVPEIPIIAGLILDGLETRGSGNTTGVLVAVPVEIQLQWVTKILPGCKNIGVLYNPAQNARTVLSAQTAVSKLGLQLHLHQVNRPSDLPAALEYLSKRIDALWAVPDELVYNSSTARHILLFSLQNKIPLIGLSATWVKAGALFSIDADYREIGIQCAELAAQVLRGRKPNAIPLVDPRKITYSLNLKTAAHLKLEIPEAIIQGAREVFR